MAGIYIHIPFCIQKCGYCDFYSIIRLTDKSNFVAALCKEIQSRKQELNNEEIKSIYFGGGTPSLLKKEDFEAIIGTLKNVYDFSTVEELTIEVNPDDINNTFLSEIKNLGFNRLSMGVQSFNNRILTFMNRRHNAEDAINAIELSKKNGFDNISIDLIYGIPKMTFDEWENSINTAINLDVQHISAYHLTFEPGTAFYKKLKNKVLNEVDDKESIAQYNVLINKFNKAGFDDYEISNFCRIGLESKHNSSYWTGDNYMGFGPSAHSFSNNTRRWNVSDLGAYINNINRDEVFYENEILQTKDIYNETIMLGLRTKKGVNISSILKMDNQYVSIFNEKMQNNILSKNTYEQDGYLKVCKDKRILTDQIISDFFSV